MTNRAHSQENVYYPNFFSVTQFHGSQFSPAYIPLEGRFEFTSGYKSLIGAFHNVANYYFSGSRTLRDSNGNTHSFRVNFSNDKNGPYISSPKLMVNYAYKLRLASKTYITAGFAFGGAGISYSAPSSTMSDIYVPDGNIGLTIQWRNVSLSGASMQIFNSTSGQGTAPIIFHRYYQFYGSVYKDWYTGWKITGNAMFRNLPYQYNQAWGGLFLEYKKHVSIGANLAISGTLSSFMSWTAHLGEDLLTISFVYNSNIFNKLPTWQDNIELGLNYVLR
jgi:hypothetical protein